MANEETDRMYKAVRKQMLRLLRERVNDPTLQMRTEVNSPQNTCEIATMLLVRAGYVTRFGEAKATGHITLAGMDYYRRETKRFRWAQENWFPVAVVFVAVVAAMGGPVFDFLWGIVLP